MKVLLITPPFTQLNTAYPATAYLKGFLNTLHVDSFQTDLSLEVILEIFSSKGLIEIFKSLEENEIELSENAYRIFTQRKNYIRTIEPVIRFLQNKDMTLAHHICADGYLPKAGRFQQNEDLDWAFGSMGTHDKARHLATLYLEDLGDLISECIDEHFGFSRYAERLARTATHFDELYTALHEPGSLVSLKLIDLLQKAVSEQNPDVVCITIPFPGNVFSALKCGQFIKKYYPQIKIILGGGYVNTELRRVYDERIFEFVDFITLDDGEAPLQHILEFLSGQRAKSDLKRTFCLSGGVVSYCNGSNDFDIPQKEVGTPDYRDLLLDRYLSVIEVINPMHRLWSDGRWNKLTLAHGCYWGKCSFCDVTLDYIKRYEPVSASILCDRIEEIIAQTGQHGFHFVDEAAPPALMRDLAMEILKRQITVVWWTNIRFEKSFTKDLCTLLSASGCIAVSGGLEVASDRLLEKMKKGVTVAQVATVADAFTSSGIMVHAYLMYGFPTQTSQETIDSLEMVRQMFQIGVIQSAFWHQFAMTAHSPVGIDPEAFGVVHTGPDFGGFAENDFFHTDVHGADHPMFSDGLKLALYNYMQGLGFDESLSEWFDFVVPETTIAEDYIEYALNALGQKADFKDHDRVLWIGGEVTEMVITSVKNNPTKNTKNLKYAEIIISGMDENYSLFFEEKTAYWIIEVLKKATPLNPQKYSFADFRTGYKSDGKQDFESFLISDSFRQLKDKGLLIL